jgi:hypothetical protein
MAKHNLKSLLKGLGQILVSDDPAEGLETLADEVRQEAKKDLGEYKPELPGDGKPPALVVEGEEVPDAGPHGSASAKDAAATE